jgi:hypothetical protein
MVDAQALEDAFLTALMWGFGFGVAFFVPLTWAVLRILSHPTVRSIARAADKLSKGGEGGIWGTLIKEGIGFLKGNQGQ